ncbi:MAG: c-type cytochrome [Rhodospirillaceae bacterium]|nr:c-type cytochrome [Rhodospirillaceae bacterium]
MLRLTVVAILAAVLWWISPGHVSVAAQEPGGESARASFSRPIDGLDVARQKQFLHGAAIFRQRWSPVGEGDAAFAGLGPTFDAVACAACHVRAGRGRPPMRQGEALSSLLIRLSIPGVGAHGGPRPHPAYGGQLAGRAIAGVPREAKLFVEYTPRPGKYGDGTPYQLRHPVYVSYQLSFGPLGDAAMLSPRVAPALPGAGLLEAIPEADILARADAGDADGDGISGRPNYVWDPLAGAERLGRFGWKAGEAGLMQQTAAAAFGDMGLTSALHPEQSCPPPQHACQAAPAAAGPELSAERLAALVAYLRYLAPPPRQNAENPAVKRGKKLFHATGCAACHIPSAQTGPPFAGQKIAPYSDLLLHDMGQGLADNRPDFTATGQEWRTPPLWGLGALMAVNGHEFLLHDGRARGIAEAILWHGGEARPAREAFSTMDAGARADLLAFLRSL